VTDQAGRGAAIGIDDGAGGTRQPLLAGIWPLPSAQGPATLSSGFRLARADWRLLLGLFLATRVLLVAGILVAYVSNTSRLEVGADDLFCNWDCDWYVGIADGGYQSLRQAGASGAANWAFFPLLPVLMWALSHATGLPTVYAGLVIAQLASAAGLYAIFLAARDLKGEDFARHAAIVSAFWPFAIHAAMPMTEALFVPLTIAAFLFARRGDWLLAAVAAALVSATRTVGVVLVLPFLMLAIREYGLLRVLTLRPGTERAAIAIGATGLGLGLFMIHLYGITGDALAFSHNQIAWSRKFELPWMMVVDELNPITIGANWLVANVLDLGTGFAALALFAWLWRQGFRPEALFAAATLSIAFLSGNASSLPRYSGSLYPAILGVALLSAAPLRRLPVYAALAAGCFACAVAWGLEQFYVM